MAHTRRRGVTKTDLTRYIRCPYAFWLVDTGQLSFAETVTPLQAGLIEEGAAFHERVEVQAERMAEDVDLPTLFRRDGLRLIELPLLANAKLGFRGVPDGVDTEGGALVPVEFKSHRDVLPIDKVELAFYWLLLERFRTRHEPLRGAYWSSGAMASKSRWRWSWPAGTSTRCTASPWKSDRPGATASNPASAAARCVPARCATRFCGAPTTAKT